MKIKDNFKILTTLRTVKTILFSFFLTILVNFSNAQYTKILDFDNTNGHYPYGDLVSDGSFLYGMTYYGGINNFGVIYKIKPDGSNYIKLLDFAGTTNGKTPYGSLIFNSGFLYGMTYGGGTNGMGTIFKIKTDGTNYVKLLDFAGANNGKLPNGTLFYDGSFLYGMTFYGGANNSGVVFKIKPDGSNYVKLLDFGGTANGSNPMGSLISDGSFLYGMTWIGGTENKGTIFKIKPDGSNYLKLMDFAGITNGSYPQGSLIYDGTFLYGMTTRGGTNDSGTVFLIKPDGSNFIKLYDFGGITNGSYPWGSLISDGTFLYGTAEFGGTNNLGVVFKIKPDGSNYFKLMDFEGTTNGQFPVGSLISDGSFLYGTTLGGGSGTGAPCAGNGCGVVFKYALGTGVAEMSIESEVAIYPNPNTGVFSITARAVKQSLRKELCVQITIYNLLGKVIYQSLISDCSTTIDLTKHNKGIYFIVVDTQNKSYNKKLIIQ